MAGADSSARPAAAMMAGRQGKRGLVVVPGIADGSSIAHGCAKAFGDAGAQLAVSYLDAGAEPCVRLLAE